MRSRGQQLTYGLIPSYATVAEASHQSEVGEKNNLPSRDWFLSKRKCTTAVGRCNQPLSGRLALLGILFLSTLRLQSQKQNQMQESSAEIKNTWKSSLSKSFNGRSVHLPGQGFSSIRVHWTHFERKIIDIMLIFFKITVFLYIL